MAHFSQDPKLLEAFHTDCDLFTQMASKWLNKAEKEVSSKEREQVDNPPQLTHSSVNLSHTVSCMEWVRDLSWTDG